MIALLMKAGLGARAAKLLAYVAIPLLVAFIVWRALDAYGDGRADERETEVRGEYKAATDRFKKEAAQSASRADDVAALRVEEHVEQVQAEKEKLDEAERNGSSRFDVMFGP